jgi:hypothetical protein
MAMESKTTVDLLKFLLSVAVAISAVIAWFVNEKRKRAWEEYQRKEARYQGLLQAMRGFYAEINDKEKKDQFTNIDENED